MKKQSSCFRRLSDEISVDQEINGEAYGKPGHRIGDIMHARHDTRQRGAYDPQQREYRQEYLFAPHPLIQFRKVTDP